MADSVGDSAEAEALEALVVAVASAVVAAAPVGEIQARDSADLPSEFRAVRNG